MEEICRLGKESLKEIVAFDCLCFPTDFWRQEDWENLLKDECAIYYALLDGEQIVAGLFLYNWQGKRDYVKIMSLAVHPKYRKQGLGERLLRHAEQERTHSCRADGDAQHRAVIKAARGVHSFLHQRVRVSDTLARSGLKRGLDFLAF